MSRLKLNQLQMLIAVIDSRSFGSAAVQIGCTQSRVSHAISELEEVLGVRLLLRSRSGCEPTDAGHRVVAKARQILSLSDSLMDDAKDDLVIEGRVRIACFRSVSTHLLPHALKALTQEHPGVRVDVDDNYEEREDVELAVARGRADLGIAQLPVGPEMTAFPYLSDSYVVVTPSSSSLRTPISWTQLHNLPYIQLNCSGARAVLERCRNAGFQSEPSLTVATDSSVLAMVSQGMGCSFLPHLAVFPPPVGVKVHELPIAAKRQFSVIALPKLARSKPVKVVIQAIRAERNSKMSHAFRAGIVHW